jgi:hypothetical protein
MVLHHDARGVVTHEETPWLLINIEQRYHRTQGNSWPHTNVKAPRFERNHQLLVRFPVLALTVELS